MEKKKKDEKFVAEQMVFIGLINQSAPIRVNSIGDIVLISQFINGSERTVFVDAHFIELLTKMMLNFKNSYNGNY